MKRMVSSRTLVGQDELLIHRRIPAVCRLLFPPVINPIQEMSRGINSGADDQIWVGIQVHYSIKWKRRLGAHSIQHVFSARDFGAERRGEDFVVDSRICEARILFVQ